MEEPGPSFNKHGELKQRVKFIGAEPCGAPALVSYTENGSIRHRCSEHMPERMTASRPHRSKSNYKDWTDSYPH